MTITKNKFLLVANGLKDIKKLSLVIDALSKAGFSYDENRLKSSTKYLSINPYRKSVIPFVKVADETPGLCATINICDCDYAELRMLITISIMFSAGKNLHYNGKTLVIDNNKESFINQLASDYELNLSILKNSIKIKGITVNEVYFQGYNSPVNESDFKSVFGCGFKDFKSHAEFDDQVKTNGDGITIRKNDESVTVSSEFIEQIADCEYRDARRSIERFIINGGRKNSVVSHCEKTISSPEMSFYIGKQEYAISKIGILSSK